MSGENQQNGWNEYSRLVLKELETLADGIEGLRSEIQEVKQEIALQKVKEDKVSELKAWKERVDEVVPLRVVDGVELVLDEDHRRGGEGDDEDGEEGEEGQRVSANRTVEHERSPSVETDSGTSWPTGHSQEQEQHVQQELAEEGQPVSAGHTVDH